MKGRRKCKRRLKIIATTVITLAVVSLLFNKVSLTEANASSYLKMPENKIDTVAVNIVSVGNTSQSAYDDNNKVVKQTHNASLDSHQVYQGAAVNQNREENGVKNSNGALVGNHANSKVAYLTFDDGPSRSVTPTILDILRKENVKATFFVIGKSIEKCPDLLIREKEEGHAIGNHTYSHDYNYLYSNTNNFMEDLAKNDRLIKSIIGTYNDKLIRFPAGSFGREVFVQAVVKEGYNYIDWNCLNGDAEGGRKTVDQLINKVKDTIKGQKALIILMHDAAYKESTAKALPVIIEYLKSQGYSFKIY